MSIRFLADENFDYKTLTGLKRREPDLDIVAVQDVGLRGADDARVLAWAADEERIVVTHDVSTMLDFAYLRVSRGLPMPGLFEIPATLARADIIGELVLIAGASEPWEWKDTVRYLPASVAAEMGAAALPVFSGATAERWSLTR